MKKTLLLVVVMVLGVTVANAQHFTKGTKTFSANATGLNFGVTDYKDYDDTFIDLGIVGKGSYFIIDNLAVTAGLGFNYSKYGSQNSHAFIYEAGARYYMVKGLFGALAYEGAASKGGDYISYGRVEVGYDIYISDKVFFEPAIYFKKGFGDTASDITQYGLSLGIGINF